MDFSKEEIAQNDLFVKEGKMFIDTHAHICGNEMWGNIEEILQRAFALSVYKINVIATNQEELERAFLIKSKYPQAIDITAATTPHNALFPIDPFFKAVEKAAIERKLVAIGETGLEYFHKDLSIEKQKAYLTTYFKLAQKSNLPLVFHCREAFQDLFSLADEYYKGQKALLHCFTGSLEEAKQVLKRGWLISISGIATFKKSEELRQVIEYTPLTSLVAETDSPYLSPQSKRGKPNEPSYVLEVYELIASLKKLPLDLVSKQIFMNAKEFFSF